MRRFPSGCRRQREYGAALVLVAVSLVALLSVMALAIDLGFLYVARSEAQRASDAAALAGANVFDSSGCATLNTCDTPAVQLMAAQAAYAAAERNLVAGAPPQISCGSDYTGTTCPPGDTPGITFTYPASTEPQITVHLQQTGIPTIFAKMFGVFSGAVATQSTAEAYVGSTVGQCVVPFLIPNCDPNPTDITTAGTNTACAGGSYAPLVTNADPPAVASPGVYPSGVYGEPWTLHYLENSALSAPNGSVAPSQWSMADFGSASGGPGGGINSVTNYIVSCAPVTSTGSSIGCGSWVRPETGNAPMPIDQAVNQRIHASGDGPTITTQDTMSTTAFGNCSIPDFPITVGTWNSTDAGTTFCGAQASSPSVMLAPIYSTNQLGSGCSTSQLTNCQVQVVGFLQLFVDYSAKNAGTELVQANVLNVLPCGGPTVTTSGPAIPIRLIQKAD